MMDQSANVASYQIPEGRLVLENMTLAMIASGVAAKHGLTMDQIRSKDRRWEISHPRQEAMFLARKAKKSLGQIARFFGFDHTTVIHGVRAHEKRIKDQEEIG